MAPPEREALGRSAFGAGARPWAVPEPGRGLPGGRGVSEREALGGETGLRRWRPAIGNPGARAVPSWWPWCAGAGSLKGKPASGAGVQARALPERGRCLFRWLWRFGAGSAGGKSISRPLPLSFTPLNTYLPYPASNAVRLLFFFPPGDSPPKGRSLKAPNRHRKMVRGRQLDSNQEA
jgi:hypothetical protein